MAFGWKSWARTIRAARADLYGATVCWHPYPMTGEWLTPAETNNAPMFRSGRSVPPMNAEGTSAPLTFRSVRRPGSVAVPSYYAAGGRRAVQEPELPPTLIVADVAADGGQLRRRQPR